MGFSSQAYCNRLPCPPTGDLPNPRIEPGSSALQADSLLYEPPGKSKEFQCSQESNLGSSDPYKPEKEGQLKPKAIKRK